MSEIKLDNFQDLAEIVALQNFDHMTKTLNEQRKKFKKAVLINKAPKKAVLKSKAVRKVINGVKFTPKKAKMHGRVIHYTNAKNAFMRAQKRKSRKSKHQ